MPSPPAFQFYADDFFAGVATMTDAEAGIYIRLICLEWSKGFLDERSLRAATFDGDIDLAREVLESKFIQNEEGYWFNERLEKVREIQQSRTRAGSKGGSTTQANAKQTPSKSPTFASGFASEAKVKPPSPSPTPTPSPTSSSISTPPFQGGARAAPDGNGDTNSLSQRFAGTTAGESLTSLLTLREGVGPVNPLVWQAEMRRVASWEDAEVIEAVDYRMASDEPLKPLQKPPDLWSKANAKKKIRLGGPK